MLFTLFIDAILLTGFQMPLLLITDDAAAAPRQPMPIAALPLLYFRCAPMPRYDTLSPH